MKKVKDDDNTRVFVNMECKRHPEQVTRFYCSNLDCRTHLCRICFKEHPKEHLPTITTIENVKEKALTSIQSQIENKVKKTLETIVRSDQMHRMFKETFFTLMQQNTTMSLDEEDIVDIVADTLARKYFPKEISIPQMTEENCTLKLESQQLMSFDFKSYESRDDYEQSDDSGAENNQTENEEAKKWYEKYHQKFIDKTSEFYGRNPLQTLHLKSKGETILWNAQYQKLYYSGGSYEEKKYTIREPFNSLTVLDLEGPLFIAAADNKLVLYSIKNDENLENNQPLKLFKEFPHNEIVFLESDSKELLFVVSVTLKASIYGLSNKLDLQELASFRLPYIPKNVVIDRANGLLFIQYKNNILEIYRGLSQTPRLIKKFRDRKGIDFSWHQSSRKLLLLSSGKLYQFDKGNFKLLRVVDKSINCMDLSEFGIIGTDRNQNLYLISQKNIMKRKILPLPSVQRQMDLLQDQIYDIVRKYLNKFADAVIGDLEINFKKIKLVADDPTHLLIYLNVDYEQLSSQERREDSYLIREFGGTIFTQWLLKYNLKQEKYQVSYH